MQNIITLEVLSATSEKSFSLDELVFRTKKLFETEGLAGFVGLILGLTDERICTNMVQTEGRTKKLILTIAVNCEWSWECMKAVQSYLWGHLAEKAGMRSPLLFKAKEMMVKLSLTCL